MSDFSLGALLDSRRGEDLDLWARTINPQFARVLRTIGFDRTWARAEGAYLYDADGARYLDLLGGFGMYGVGRNNPRVRAALVEALELETPGMLAMGTTLLPGLLAEELIGLAGGRIERCLFTSSGTESVEAAIKLGRAATKRERVVSAEHGFHGLTLGSLSANGNDEFTARFQPLLPGFAQVPFGDLEALEARAAARGRRALPRRGGAGQGDQPPAGRLPRGSAGAVPPLRDALLRRRGDDRIRADGPDVRLPALGARAGSRHGGEDAVRAATCRSARSSWRAPCTRRSSTRCRTRCRTARRSRRTSSRWRPASRRLHELREQRLVEQSARLGERLLELTRPLVDEFDVVGDVRGLGLAWAIEFAEPQGGGRRTYRMIERAQHGPVRPARGRAALHEAPHPHPGRRPRHGGDPDPAAARPDATRTSTSSWTRCATTIKGAQGMPSLTKFALTAAGAAVSRR